VRISTTLESILRTSGDEEFDDAAAAAHHTTPHFTYYVSRIGDLAERTAIVLESLEVA
jgi:quinol monooxygenase YgiN